MIFVWVELSAPRSVYGAYFVYSHMGNKDTLLGVSIVRIIVFESIY